MKLCKEQKIIKQACSAFGFQAIEFLNKCFIHSEKPGCEYTIVLLSVRFETQKKQLVSRFK